MAVVKKILIVEDDPLFVGILSRLLKPWKAEISSTFSGAEAVRMMKSGEFDLVLIDLQLPLGDAPELLDFISSSIDGLVSRCLIVTSFPGFGKTLSDLPVVAKTKLVDLGPHFLRVLGSPVHDDVSAVA